MRVYIESTGHIKNHQNFKILFWSRESKKPILRIFRNFFTKKWDGNLGITSETTWESRVKRPGEVRLIREEFHAPPREAESWVGNRKPST